MSTTIIKLQLFVLLCTFIVIMAIGIYGSIRLAKQDDSTIGTVQINSITGVRVVRVYSDSTYTISYMEEPNTGRCYVLVNNSMLLASINECASFIKQ